MPTGTIVLLGAFAGLTIFLGLPLAFLKNIAAPVKSFLGMLATGVLLFLLYDVIGKASEPIGVTLGQLRTHHTGVGAFFLEVFLLVLGIGLGSVGLVYFNKYIFGLKRSPRASVGEGEVVQQEAFARASTREQAVLPAAVVPPLAERPVSVVAAAAKGEMAPRTLALLIATGIGLHNFSEGLAIGQSAAMGAMQLAIVLIVGFGLHNMTEGFGIAGPLTGEPVSWKFVGLLGLIGGGPTFVGTIIGMFFNSPQIFIFFLALAAGAIIYVIVELLGVAKRFKAPEIVMWGLVIGFLLGYATDLIVTYGGA